MENNQTSVQATKDHCKYCFDVLIATLNKQELPKFPKNIVKSSTPLFVTWNIDDDDLRGCIGTFASSAIDKTLGKYAQIAAFQDSRFNPINQKEVPRLKVSVSLLVNFEEGKKALDWEVGQHGIQIDFNVDGQQFGATYLPEVAAEQEWTQEEAIKSLVRKAGYRGNYKNVLSSINLTTYQSSKCKLSYEEYTKIK
ncbi:AMMECR1 domain [Pseudocohnilembus persalinus]|uniref:AMMECR1 domain n=1 Tax=Pseudocohnilembus persalinus TaxID=266149 RepID=A0A0V0Q7Z8_PSEPJ|nr:AMMECR1 domain [Pseudocohnilembus persalinus]|eukprot:KRW98318.1 AMMECR1 domain [Pseudocohnilembus persalinus]